MSLVNSASGSNAIVRSAGTKRTRRTWTDEDKAKVLIAFRANDGNIKRTAREQNVPLSTFKTWVNEWKHQIAMTGGVDLPVDMVEQAREEFVNEAKEVRDMAIRRIKDLIPEEGNISKLVAVVGVLDDKATRAEGAPGSTIEHVIRLPDADELRSIIDNNLESMIGDAITRNQDIIDVESTEVEQPKLGLPDGG